MVTISHSFAIACPNKIFLVGYGRLDFLTDWKVENRTKGCGLKLLS